MTKYLTFFLLMLGFVASVGCFETNGKIEKKSPKVDYAKMSIVLCACGDGVMSLNKEMEALKKQDEYDALLEKFEVLDKEVRALKKCVFDLEKKNGVQLLEDEQLQKAVDLKCPLIYKTLKETKNL